MKFENQESAIEAAQCEARWKCVGVKKNELINTQLAARIMIFIMSATVLSGCTSVNPEFLPQTCAITNCGDTK